MRQRIERLETRNCLTSVGFADHVIQVNEPVDDAILADFNGDGRDDVAGSSFRGISLRVSNADGTLERERLVAPPSQLLAVVDIDADGDMDVVAHDAEMFWLENLSEGLAFARHALSDLPVMARAGRERFAVDDVDADGSLDFVYLANSQQLVTVFDVTDPTVSISPVAITSLYGELQIGNIDSDDLMEVFIQQGYSTRYWFDWNGTSFASRQSPSGLPDEGPLYLADPDRDGNLDVMANNVQYVTRYEMNGDTLEFEKYEVLYDPDSLELTFAIADHDGDGRQDIVFSRYLDPGNELQVFRVSYQGSDGRFAPAVEAPGTSDARLSTWAVGDLQGDEKTNIVTFSRLGQVSADGFIAKAEWNGAGWIESVDLDDDGDLDLITGGLKTSSYDGYVSAVTSLRWYENLDGASDFHARDEVFSNNWISLEDHVVFFQLIDVDHDGDSDVVTAFGGELFWNRNLGNGLGFGAQQVFASDIVTDLSVGVADLDSNGLLEIVRLDNETRQVFAREQTADDLSTFSDERLLFTATEPIQNLQVVDVSNDSLPDILVLTGSVARKIAVYKNQGDGTYGAAQVVGDDLYEFFLEDLDGDQTPEIIVAGDPNGGAFRWYNNEGQGTFSAAQSGPVRESIGRIVEIDSGDFDGDGKLELLVGAHNGIYSYEYSNGGFASEEFVYAASGVGALHVVDLNQDGKLDWVSSAAHTWSGLRWHEQRTTGDVNNDGRFDSQDLVALFQVNQYEDDIVGNSTFVTGDFNGDGDFDSGDLVTAFQDGGYEAGLRPAVAAVSE
ncbi:MAG: VCBS repeat-containing protein [Planctomycetales bacterium]|nr:VCBS repeat-containing protein [Planctomycetales bacterium]